MAFIMRNSVLRVGCTQVIARTKCAVVNTHGY